MNLKKMKVETINRLLEMSKGKPVKVIASDHYTIKTLNGKSSKTINFADNAEIIVCGYLLKILDDSIIIISTYTMRNDDNEPHIYEFHKIMKPDIVYLVRLQEIQDD